MTELVDSMWVEATRDTAAEARDRALALARVKCSGLWPFLSAAGSVEEYRQRLALTAERLEAACDEVAPGDRALAEQLVAGLDADFGLLHREREGRRELERRVAAELARRAPAPAPKPAPVEQSASHARALRDRLADAHAIRRRAAEEPQQQEQIEQPPAEPAEPTPEPLAMGAPRLGYGSGTDQVDCPACRGTGHAPGTGGSEDCPVCHGEGAVPASEAHAWHTSSMHHTAPDESSTRMACRKCVGGQTPDRQACGYCLGRGSLDVVTATIQAADGWDQGLVRLTATGAVQFDPDAFGSERWQKLAPVPTPPWIVDEWGTPHPPVPAPGMMTPPVPSREPAPPRVAAGPADNEFKTTGPGVPGSAESPGAATYPQHAGDVPSEVVAPADTMLGDADPMVAAQRPEETFTRPPDVVSRLAARVLAANPEVGHEGARRVALATLRRFPAVQAGR